MKEIINTYMHPEQREARLAACRAYLKQWESQRRI
jgi:hypothetical protein